MSIASSNKGAWLRAGLVCVLLALAPRAHADWARDYIRGMEAFDNGDYKGARTLLQGVIAENPKPEAMARLQPRRMGPYLPQLYLGLALAKLNDCPGAVAQLNQSALITITKQIASAESQRSGALQRCQTRLAEVSAPAPTPTVTPAAPTVTPAAPTPETAAPTPETAASVPAIDSTVASTAKPPPLASIATPPPSTAPTPTDTWPKERDRIRALLDIYLQDRLTTTTVPAPETFTSPRARQWAYLVRSLLRAREGLMATSASNTLGAARRDYASARELGELPPTWRELASPRVLAAIAGKGG